MLWFGVVFGSPSREEVAKALQLSARAAYAVVYIHHGVEFIFNSFR